MARRIPWNARRLYSFLPKLDYESDDLELTAIHEIAHLLVGFCLCPNDEQMWPRHITIEPKDDYLGIITGMGIAEYLDDTVLMNNWSSHVSPQEKIAFIRHEVLYSLSGYAAEALFTRDFWGVNTMIWGVQTENSDNTLAFRWLEYLHSEYDGHEIAKTIDYYGYTAMRLLCYRPIIRAIQAGADYLLENPFLIGIEIVPLIELMESTMGRRFLREHRGRVNRFLYADDPLSV